jgi:hypothetical protein
MNAPQRETATLIERVRRVWREPRKLFELVEVQKQPEELLERNSENAPKIPGNRRRQSEAVPLRSVTARFSLRSDEQKTQTLPREVLGKGIKIGKTKKVSGRRLGRPLRNQKRTRKRSKFVRSGLPKERSCNQSTSANNESFRK